MILNILEVS